MNPGTCAAFLLAAFTLAGFFHTAWLVMPASQRFAVPIDGGLKFRRRRLFGDNKMVRGFLVMIPATGLSFALLAVLLSNSPAGLTGLWPLSPGGYALLGLWAGIGFMAGELPNSFIKRQLDIAPGTAGATVLPELGPEPNDLVLSRWHGIGPMGGTDLDAILRNLGVSTVVAVGGRHDDRLMTGGCVGVRRCGCLVESLGVSGQTTSWG